MSAPERAKRSKWNRPWPHGGGQGLWNAGPADPRRGARRRPARGSAVHEGVVAGLGEGGERLRGGVDTPVTAGAGRAVVEVDDRLEVRHALERRGDALEPVRLGAGVPWHVAGAVLGEHEGLVPEPVGHEPGVGRPGLGREREPVVVVAGVPVVRVPADPVDVGVARVQAATNCAAVPYLPTWGSGSVWKAMNSLRP